jgi:hypothetical protein
MELIAIKEATMSQLVSFYNTHAVRLQDGKKVNKFADRPTAEKRCAKLGDSLAAYFEATSPETVPPEGFIFVGELTNNEGEKLEIKPAGVAPVATMEKDEGVDEEDEGPNVNSFGSMGGVLAAAGEKKADEPPVRDTNGASNSVGVAISWTNKEIRSRRLTRNGVSVEVNGEVSEFRSVNAAFHHYGLPTQKHIRFRVALKAAGVDTFVADDGTKYLFAIIDKSEATE